MWEYKLARDVLNYERDALLDGMSKDGWTVESISDEDSWGSMTIIFKRPQKHVVVSIDGYKHIVDGVVAREIIWLREQVNTLLDLLDGDYIPPLPKPVYGVSPLLPFLEKFTALVAAAEDQEMSKEKKE